jgi:prepilin signal peptidase PulO-like enzyme (type II secretory pathway)
MMHVIVNGCSSRFNFLLSGSFCYILLDDLAMIVSFVSFSFRTGSRHIRTAYHGVLPFYSRHDFVWISSIGLTFPFSYLHAATGFRFVVLLG